MHDGDIVPALTEDRLRALPSRRSPWIRPPGARREIAVDLHERSYLTTGWLCGTCLLAGHVDSWDCGFLPRGRVVVLRYPVEQQALDGPPRDSPRQGTEWSWTPTLDGHPAEHDPPDQPADAALRDIPRREGRQDPDADLPRRPALHMPGHRRGSRT